FLDTKAAAEQILELNPEAVILKSYLKESVGDPIEALGIKVIYLDLETPEAINKDILTLGELFGNKERADQLVANYDMAAKKVTDVTASLTESDKPSVLMLQYSDKGDEIAFKVPPMDWLQTSLVTMAGGTPVWKDVPTDGWTTITLEQVAAWNPQVILLVDYKGRAADLVAGLKEDANWKLLDAVKNGKLYAFPLDFQSWDQPDTRWTLGLTWLAQKLHPELFPTVNMTDEVTKFYEDFYGFDQDTISSTILPLLKGDL
ncbi:MAG TPA: ABC transporter substrate-binding protein, partial [Anaerolineaceae bacterium]|nr:ABC transporter substrate-binding protein [Anaerolineaceae bacterium]